MKCSTALIPLLSLTLFACSGGAGTDIITPPAAEVPPPSAPAQTSPVRAPDPTEGLPLPESAARNTAPPAIACAPGEAPTAGCVMTHDIGQGELLDAVVTCGTDRQASNSCKSKPLSLEYIDTSLATPTSLTIAFDTAFFCATASNLTQTVLLNGRPVGSFEGNMTDCSCEAVSRQRVITVATSDMPGFNPGTANTISIVGPNRCIALRPRGQWDGAYARVIARY